MAVAGGRRLSVQHLVAATGLTLLTSTGHAADWRAAVQELGAEGSCVAVRTIDPGGDADDHDGGWAAVREVRDDGAVLVRPDRHIAWRAPAWSPDRPAQLRQAVRAVLALPMPARTR